MYRLIDWECDRCKYCITGGLTDIPHGTERPKTRVDECPVCEADTPQHSVMGAPAKYMGDKVHNPMIYGGACDTMGCKELEPLPELPAGLDHSVKLRESLKGISPATPKAEANKAFRDACKDAPTSDDYAAHFKRPDWIEANARNDKIKAENAQKRARLKAGLGGQEVNMRVDKCAGDPKI